MIRRMIKWLRKKTGIWKYLGEGNYRKTWVTPSGRFVLKIPKNEEGTYCNWAEVRDFRKHGKAGRLARCRNFKFKGQVCTVMERVTIPPYDAPDMPSWTYSIDCRQVGYDRKGNLVAYDWFYPGC